MKITEDLSKVSNVDKDILAKLFEGIQSVIVEEVYEDRLKNNPSTEIDLDFIKLIISNDNSQLKMSVIPSTKLLEELIDIEHGKEPKLKTKLEKNLVQTLSDTIKDIL